MTVVSNSSPLISLAKIESFDHLQKLYGSLTISVEVYAEVVVSGAGLPGSSEVLGSSWVQVRQVKRPDEITAAQERFGLGMGELSTLILAKELRADVVILDDLRARKLAQGEGFRVHGTMAILEACFRKGLLVDLRGAYERLLKRGVFLNRDLLNRSSSIVQTAPGLGNPLSPPSEAYAFDRAKREGSKRKGKLRRARPFLQGELMTSGEVREEPRPRR